MTTPSTPDTPPTDDGDRAPALPQAPVASTPGPMPALNQDAEAVAAPVVPEKTASELRAEEKTAKKAADQAAKDAERAAKERAKDAEKAAKAQAKREKANPVGWSAVLLAVVAMAAQSVLLNFVVAQGTGGTTAVLRYNPPGLLWDPANALASVMLVIALLASVAAVVVAIVALAGKKRPRWISWVSIGVGLAVLVGTVSFWQAATTL